MIPVAIKASYQTIYAVIYMHVPRTVSVGSGDAQMLREANATEPNQEIVPTRDVSEAEREKLKHFLINAKNKSDRKLSNQTLSFTVSIPTLTTLLVFQIL